MPGKIVLVGAGPGDPGLLTRKGQRWLEQADVVVYDYLVNPSLLNFTRPDAELVLAGKHGGGPRVEQEEIVRILLTHARAGKIVVRLKGGDQFVFGRGGEEMEAARDAGIDVEVVPGVTSALAVPAYAGIPVTHRDLASSVVIATGYEYPGKRELVVPWDKLGEPNQTLILLMTQRQLKANVQRLLAAGRPPDTPVAVTQWGTRASQRTVMGALANIVEQVERACLRPPVVAVVGDVVRLRQKLLWYERKPLFGRRIVVTRPRTAAAAFAEELEDLGAEVVEFPTIEIAPPASYATLDAALLQPEAFDWVVFTSANGVEAFIGRLRALHQDLRAWQRAKIAAIGPQTASALAKLAIRVSVMATEYRAEGLVDALAAAGISGARILLPRAVGARSVLPRMLRQLGATVVEAEAYQSILPAAPLAAFVADSIRRGEIDLVTFTSPSTVHHFVTLIAEQQRVTVAGLPAACIGPITAAAARSHAMNVVVEPAEFTVKALGEKILRYFTSVEVPDAVP